MKASLPSFMVWLSLVACGGSITANDGGSDAASDTTADVDASVIATIAAGLDCTCAISGAGTARCWGSDTGGFCGAYPPDAWSPFAVFHGPPASVASFALENNAVAEVHDCAVSPDGSLYCWGDNQSGELGSGTISAESVTMPVRALGLPPIAAAACGDGYTCALTVDGSVYCWGSAQWGELGMGLPDGGLSPYVTVPTHVALPGPASIVSAGPSAACAVVGGEVWCWGSNSDGAIGDGTTTERYSPVQTPGLTSVTSIARAPDSTCAVSGGNVYCWGSGGLGDGVSNSTSLVPKLISNGGNAAEVVMGEAHTCVLDTAGGVSCWGANVFGQVGDGTLTERDTPVPVVGLPPAIDIAAGAYHTCALTSAHAMYCWGDDSYGELGDVTTPVALDGGQRSVPTPIVVGVQ